jgi:hypothetical protein
MGGAMLADHQPVSKADFVVLPQKYKRTAKLITAMSIYGPDSPRIVAYAWLQASAQAGAPLPVADYLHPELKQALQRRDKAIEGLLNDMSMWASSKAQTSVNQLTLALKNIGVRLCDDPAKADICLYQEDAEEIASVLRKNKQRKGKQAKESKKPSVQSIKWLTSGICNFKLKM